MPIGHSFAVRRSELQGQNIKMLMPSSIADRHDAYLSEYLRTGVGNIIGKVRPHTHTTRHAIANSSHRVVSWRGAARTAA